MRRIDQEPAASHFGLAAAAVVVALVLGGVHRASAADQALIAKARGMLYTSRDESIAILEDAVRRQPDETAYWVEYINALSVDSDDAFADRASLHALVPHPRDPDLLIARDRRPWVSVIEQLGSAQDAPVLIATLDVVTRADDQPNPQNHPPDPENDKNNRLTAAAIETCLQKLTGAKPPGEDRALAWSKWWAENAARIAKGH